MIKSIIPIYVWTVCVSDGDVNWCEKKNYNIFLVIWEVGHSFSPFDQSYRFGETVVSSRSVQLVLWFRLAIRRPFQFVRRFRRPWNTLAANTAGDPILPPHPTHTHTQRIPIAVRGRSIQYWSRLRHRVPLRPLAFIIELLIQRLYVVGRGVGRGNMFTVAHTLWAEV